MTDIDIDDLAGWVDELRRATAAKAAAEERIAAARAHIEEALGDATTGLIGGQPVVKWTPVTSRRFDQSLAKATLPRELLDACYTTTTSRRFTLVEPVAP